MIEEIVPGIVQWDAFRETIGRRVHSTFVLSSGTLIDPMAPDGDDGLDAVAELATPRADRVEQPSSLPGQRSLRQALRLSGALPRSGPLPLHRRASRAGLLLRRAARGRCAGARARVDLRRGDDAAARCRRRRCAGLRRRPHPRRGRSARVHARPAPRRGCRGRAGGAHEEPAADARRGGLRHAAVRARRARLGRRPRAPRRVSRPAAHPDRFEGRTRGGS